MTKDKTIKILRSCGLGFLEPLVRMISGEEIQKNGVEFAQRALFPLFSIILFILVWQGVASYLYDNEASKRIEKARVEQGEEAAVQMEKCIASGEISCQPNTLPSPGQVWTAYRALWSDHMEISKKKDEFEQKVAATNAKRAEEGKKAIVYTGRPSFVDQILTSLKTVFAGFLLAAMIAIPIGIIIGLSKT